VLTAGILIQDSETPQIGCGLSRQCSNKKFLKKKRPHPDISITCTIVNNPSAKSYMEDYEGGSGS
jgi:hypothetical protein